MSVVQFKRDSAQFVKSQSRKKKHFVAQTHKLAMLLT
jgi:hypothetical protein